MKPLGQSQKSSIEDGFSFGANSFNFKDGQLMPILVKLKNEDSGHVIVYFKNILGINFRL